MMISIRKASSEDFDAIWRMWKEIMDQKIYYPYDESYSRQDIQDEWINVITCHPYVAILEDGTTVGAYILKPNQPGYGKHICNASYMVHSTHRGKGIGDELCQHSLESARQLGFRGIQFNLVVSTNQAAIRIWKRNGFTLVGTIPGGFFDETNGVYVDAHIFFQSLLQDDDKTTPLLLCEADPKNGLDTNET